MGKKKNTRAKLGVPPITVNGSVCGKDDKDSDVSDLESIAFSSIAGDLDTEPDDENDPSNRINSLSEFIENSQDKRIDVRSKAIDGLIHILKKDYVPDYLERWKGTIFEVIEKGLKRTCEEGVRVCTLAPLISLQLGVEIEDYVCLAVTSMRNICLDQSANESIRSSCAQAIGLCIYLSVEQFQTRFDSLQTLKDVWSSFKPSAPGSKLLFSSALYSWILLLERFDSSFISTTIEDAQPKLCTYLNSSTVEARISAGSAMAILHEIAVENIDEEFRFKNHSHLEDIFAELSVDSAKHRAKRDKKLQKTSFRQISGSIFGEKVSKFVVRFNRREELVTYGLHSKLFYDCLCQLLKSHLNKHLTKNTILRQIFDLGAILEEDESQMLNKSKKNRNNKLSE